MNFIGIIRGAPRAAKHPRLNPLQKLLTTTNTKGKASHIKTVVYLVSSRPRLPPYFGDTLGIVVNDLLAVQTRMLRIAGIEVQVPRR